MSNDNIKKLIIIAIICFFILKFHTEVSTIISALASDNDLRTILNDIIAGAVVALAAKNLK